MNTTNKIRNISEILPRDLLEQLWAIEAEDKKLFSDILSEALRLSIMVKTGNVRAWEQWKKDQDQGMNLFFRELEDAKTLDMLAKRL